MQTQFLNTKYNLIPKDTIICIREPYYKTATDSSKIIRIDNPDEITIVEKVEKVNE